jgi:hypothetical protein
LVEGCRERLGRRVAALAHPSLVDADSVVESEVAGAPGYISCSLRPIHPEEGP